MFVKGDYFRDIFAQITITMLVGMIGAMIFFYTNVDRDIHNIIKGRISIDAKRLHQSAVH